MDPKLTNTETEARKEGEEQGVNGCANEPKRDARLRRAVPVGKRRPEAGPSNFKQLEETAVRGAKVWVAPHFSLAPIRWHGFFAPCAAAIVPFSAEPSRA